MVHGGKNSWGYLPRGRRGTQSIRLWEDAILCDFGVGWWQIYLSVVHSQSPCLYLLSAIFLPLSSHTFFISEEEKPCCLLNSSSQSALWTLSMPLPLHPYSSSVRLCLIILSSSLLFSSDTYIPSVKYEI